MSKLNNKALGWLILLSLIVLPNGRGKTITEADRTHWAFQPLKKIEPPSSPRLKVQHPIDRFILFQLRTNHLDLAPRATKEQLIRRVSFGLIGLPPAPEEIDAFINDSSADAYERLIDRLLASPHYGERWARHWLDLARFAESDGFEHDAIRPHSWRYRDYVIKSFNADKPYDRFIREQLAGDELFPTDPDALIATGFNLLGPDMVDSADQVQRRHNTLNDMTDTAALVFLGQTIGCARCHNHKSEPFSQRDYYSLQAFFTPTRFDREYPVPTTAERKFHDVEMRKYDSLTRSQREQIEAIEAPYREQIHTAKLAKLSEEARLAHQTPKEQRTVEMENQIQETAELLKISEAELLKKMSAEDKATRTALVDQLKKSPKPASLPLAMALQDSGKSAKTFVLARGDYNNAGDEVTAAIPEILRSNAANEALINPKPATGALPLPSGEISDNQVSLIQPTNRPASPRESAGAKIPPTNDSRIEPLNRPAGLPLPKGEGRGEGEGSSVGRLPPAGVLKYRGVESKVRFMERGSTASDKPQPRTLLANWIASPENPLTARVMVNRIWQHHFGRGIVPSPSEFGTRAEPPSHPELLDWLAQEFVASGWSLKKMHKLILLSQTYQQSSRPSAEALARDPENRLFSRQNRVRLEGEAIRDSMLAISGQLNPKVGGPSVFPPIPADMTKGLNNWTTSASPSDHTRRSLYIFARRNLRYPFLEVFDAPDNNLSCAQRGRSTTAPQSLTLLNSSEVMAAAKSTANRIIHDGEPKADQVERAFRLIIGRAPSLTERKLADQFIQSCGSPSQEAQTPSAQTSQSLEELCRALFNINAFVYVD